MAWARGKRSMAISDRSGQAFPYVEMVREWNGSLVHISEYESKHPQIRRKKVTADAIALENARPQDFNINSGGANFTTVSLALPGDFALISDDPDAQNRARKATAYTGQVTVEIS